MNLQEGLVVADKFRLDRMIGRGGMGSVWKAHHMGLDVPCAVKFIEGELAKLQEAQQRFEREAKAAAQLRSPHVVQIYDYGVWQGTPYIAMELLDGQDLGKYLQAHGGKLHAAEVNRIMQQVCKALTKAHAAGVVHRDLKPDNIFLVNDDDAGFIVKILDFGVAKSASHTVDGSNTKTGAMLGTPYYMSPEQAQGIKSVDARSDLWSLAVIVFQCLTGRLPFESEALGDLLVKIIVAPIPLPSSFEPSLPPTIDEWWVKVADRNPENRYPSAKAFADALALRLGQSAVTDVIDRNKLLKMGGATAVMMNTPANVAGGPNTPNPYGQHHTPQNPMPPYGPPPGQPAGPHAASGATFSGVEPPIALPKKGIPVGVWVVAGVLALVGVALAGFAMRSKAQASTDTAAAASASVAAAAENVPATPGPSAEPVPAASPSASATAEATPTPSASASAEPVAAAAPAAAAPAAHHATKPAAAVAAAKPVTNPPTPAKPPPPAPPAGKKPDLGLGF
jgi:serine/threonine protein kinase